MFVDINSLTLGLITGCISLGVYTTYRLTHFTDMTCDGSVIIGAATTAALIHAGASPGLSIFAALCAGALLGLCTSALHVYARIPQIISGIMSAYLAYSLSLHIMQGAPNIPLCNHNLLFDGNPLPWLAGITATLCIIFVFFFSTNLGLCTHISGYNPTLAEQFGANPKTFTFLGTSLSNGLIALGGSLFVHYQEFADISQGFGSLITGLGSLLIGEKLLPKKPLIFPVLGCFLGAIIYQIFINLALQASWIGLEPYDTNIIVVVCMVVIMAKGARRA